MTGTELSTFCEELNGGASIGSTVLFQFINLAKAMVEQLRPWMVLRYTDTSKTVTAANTWQTAIDLSTIARLNRFYESDDNAPGRRHIRKRSHGRFFGLAREKRTVSIRRSPTTRYLRRAW